MQMKLTKFYKVEIKGKLNEWKCEVKGLIGLKKDGSDS